MTIHVNVNGSGGTAKSIINIKIVDLDKNPSTNPVTDDRNDTFSYVPIPRREEKTNVYGVLGGRNIGYGIVLEKTQDIKRLLGVYYEQNVTTEKYEDYDWERWIVFGDE